MLWDEQGVRWGGGDLRMVRAEVAAPKSASSSFAWKSSSADTSSRALGF